MTKIEEKILVLKLAMEIEDRDPKEAKAVMNFAHDIDKERNKLVATNPNYDVYRRELKQVSSMGLQNGCTDMGCRICKKAHDLLSGDYDRY